ncbi:MAG: mechanosensitive ion channel family protein, partial [Acidimicrobiales bacterium]
PWWIELIVIVGSAVLGAGLARLAFMARRHLPLTGRGGLERSLLVRLDGPVAALLMLTGAAIADTVHGIHVNGPSGTVTVHLLRIGFIAAWAWLAFRFTYVFEDAMVARLRVDRADNLRMRKIQTQIQVLRKVVGAVIVVLATAIMLLSFGSVRAAGTGLLASAGIVAVVVGVAAKPVVSNFLAGIQIAVTQPIRVDDVVVVDGHWGRIEEINLTYLVIRVWDLRRLVVPISYLISTPFENWTRTRADILGFVHLDVDYVAPVDDLRERFDAILRSSPDWDGQVATLQVTGVGPSTMQIRALMSSPDSPTSWNLQCEVREKLVAYLRDEHPEALPHLRLDGMRTTGVACGDSPDPPMHR